MCNRVLHKFFPGDLVYFNNVGAHKPGMVLSVRSVVEYPYFKYCVQHSVLDKKGKCSWLNENDLLPVKTTSNDNYLAVAVGSDVICKYIKSSLFRVCEIFLGTLTIATITDDLVLADIINGSLQAHEEVRIKFKDLIYCLLVDCRLKCFSSWYSDVLVSPTAAIISKFSWKPITGAACYDILDDSWCMCYCIPGVCTTQSCIGTQPH